MKNKCEHTVITKIDHWWFNFKCQKCGKRFKWLPRGDWYTLG